MQAINKLNFPSSNFNWKGGEKHNTQKHVQV